MIVDNPNISVIIPAYNAAETISTSLRSALSSHLVVEVIVVDDASRDSTQEIVRNIADKDQRVVLLTREANSGPAAARNMALEKARGEYIAILDADDFFLPGRLEKIATFIRSYDFVADDLLFCRTMNGPIYPRNLFVAPRKQIGFTEFIAANVIDPRSHRRELGFLKPVMSKQFLLDNNLRYDETLRLGEDYAFYARALLVGARFVLVEALGYVALERPDSISAQHTIEDLQALWTFDRDLLKTLRVPSEYHAVMTHMNVTKDRLQLRRFLEAKTNHKYSHMLRQFFQSSRTANYIAREIIRLKLGF